MVRYGAGNRQSAPRQTSAKGLKRKIAVSDATTKLAKIVYGLLIFGVTALAFAGLAYWESTLPSNCGNDGVCFSYDYGEMTKFRIVLGTVFVVFGTMVKYADYEQRKAKMRTTAG